MSHQRVDLCLASMFFLPDYAGPAIRFYRYQPGLKERGVDMRVFTQAFLTGETLSGASQTHRKIGDLLPVDYVDAIPVHRMYASRDRGSRGQLTYDRALTRHVASSAGRPDLIQFLDLQLYSIPWLRKLRRQGIPLLLTNTMVGELSPKKWKRILQRRYWKLPFQLMDCVVVSSGVMKDSLCDIGVSTRIEVIPNGVDLHRFEANTSPAERNDLRERLGYQLQDEIILFVGPIISRKGVDILLKAFFLLARDRPTARLILVGPDYNGPMMTGAPTTEFRKEIDKMISDSGIANRVVFSGTVDNVEDYYRVADLFVFPSKREGMPNVVLEAYASRLPVIMTDFLGLPAEFGRAGEQYIWADRSPEALAQAMGSILADDEQRERIGLNGLRWAEQNLGVEQSMDRYADLYMELAEQGRQREPQR